MKRLTVTYSGPRPSMEFGVPDDFDLIGHTGKEWLTIQDPHTGFQAQIRVAEVAALVLYSDSPSNTPPSPPPPPPTVTSLRPAAGATAVPAGTTVAAAFSRAMAAETITPNSFTLAPASGAPVPAAVTYDSASSVATLAPTAPLASATVYRARLDATVAAYDGPTLPGARGWTFTTA